MDKKKIKKREVKSVRISIRTTPAISKFMKEKDYSPSLIFAEAVKDLMEG